MKTVTLLAISALVFFSIAAAPAPEKETSVKKCKQVRGWFLFAEKSIVKAKEA
jgi:hypothetical protein